MALSLDTAVLPQARVDHYFDNPGAACDDIEHFERVLMAVRATLSGEPGSNSPTDLASEISRMGL